jgi:hypothetical protein
VIWLSSGVVEMPERLLLSGVSIAVEVMLKYWLLVMRKMNWKMLVPPAILLVFWASSRRGPSGVLAFSLLSHSFAFGLRPETKVF